MIKKNRTAVPGQVDEAPAREVRHAQDARVPPADDPSDLPVRAGAIPEGSPGELAPAHASGYQQASEAVHPDFPDQGDAAGSARPRDDEAVRKRAYELWERNGRPDGGHERHWLQAERELRDRRAQGL